MSVPWRDTSEAHEGLIEYLESMTTHFKPPMCPIERLVLERGQNFIAAKRPKGMRKRANKQCFRNAANLILEGFHLDYVEGYAIHDGLIPLHHAWCVDRNNHVVDVTWLYPERSVYRGVIIPKQVLVDTLRENGIFGVLDLWIKPNMKLIEQLMQEEKAA